MSQPIRDQGGNLVFLIGPKNTNLVGDTETSCVFYIPELLARGYQANKEFHNTSYGMKIHLRFFLSHQLARNEQITT